MFNVAIVGATGNVGREIIKILEERKFPIKEIHFLASPKSEGKVIEFLETKIIVKSLEKFDFKGIDIVLSSPGSKVSQIYSPIAAKAGAIVIDNTSYFRQDPDIPLIAAEVNDHDLIKYRSKNIIANPNCSTIQILLALKPIHDKFNITRIITSTYQATSGAGKELVERLKQEVHQSSSNNKKNHQNTIGFNVICKIGDFTDENSTTEEEKVSFETNKILDKNIKVHANCARVPVINCHSAYVNIETAKEISLEEVSEIFKNTPHITLSGHNDANLYATPMDVSGSDNVFVSKIRKDKTIQNGLSFWCVADNLRVGAALNAVKIAEKLIKDFL